MSEIRPRQLTPEMALRAAKSIVSELIKRGDVEERDVELYARDIAKHGRQYMDGYELARALDTYCGWECNLEIAEALDGFASYARGEIETAEKAWAERVNPAPPFATGTRVRLARGETGTITGIYEHGAAKFLIAIDGDVRAAPPSCSRRIVNFEDVVAA